MEYHGQRGCSLLANAHPHNRNPDAPGKGRCLVVRGEQDRNEVTEQRGIALAIGQRPNQIVGPVERGQSLREAFGHFFNRLCGSRRDLSQAGGNR